MRLWDIYSELPLIHIITVYQDTMLFFTEVLFSLYLIVASAIVKSVSSDPYKKNENKNCFIHHTCDERKKYRGTAKSIITTGATPHIQDDWTQFLPGTPALTQVD